MEYEFILFLDPDTQQFYSFCESEGILIKETPPAIFANDIANDLKMFKFLRRDYPKSNEAYNSFQVRPIPSAFLTARKYRFPIYSTQQPIYEAMLEEIQFSEDNILMKNQYKECVKMKVYLGDIQGQVELARQLYPHVNTEYIKEVDVKLITSANEVIRTLVRKILQDYKIVITTKSAKSRFILKVKNREEYMYGNEAISSYLCVLDCLKDNKTLEVEIKEKDVTKGRQQFNKFIFTRKQADVTRGIFESYPWTNLLNKEEGPLYFFMWHRPDISFVDLKYLQDKSANTEEMIEIKSRIKIDMHERKRKKEPKVIRFLLKQSVEIFLSKRRAEIQQKLVSISGSTIYTGQCLFVYSFQIAGLKNMLSLLDNRALNPENKIIKRNFLKLFNNVKDQSEENLINFNNYNKLYAELVQIKKSGRFAIVPYMLNVGVQLYHNGEIKYKEQTAMQLINKFPIIKETIAWESLCNIPLETTLVVKIKVYSKEGEGYVCGVGALKLFDEYGYLRQGAYEIQLLASDNINAVKMGCYNHFIDNNPKIGVLVVELPKFKQCVRWTLSDHQSLKLIGYSQIKTEAPPIEIEYKMSELTKLLSYDPLKMLTYTDEEKLILRFGKKYYKHQSDKLINYLYSINWFNCTEVGEAYQALKDWSPLKPIEALFLLSPRLSDQKVRYFAVKTVDKLKNRDFCLYSNQITQALVSFETHENPLIDLIIERCCQDPYVVGHQYFWQFWNRTSEYITSFRFILYLQTLIMTSPIRFEFSKQVRTYVKLVFANEELIRKTEDMEFYKKNEKFKSMIKKIEEELLSIDDEGFSFPIRPERKFKRLLPEKSKMFDSKKLPFSLACSSAATTMENDKKQQAEYYVMFKYGDDIKQDHLVLQIFTIFNKLWIEAGFDLKMNIYRTLSTGDQIGFIEIVENAENNSYIHKQFSDKFAEAFDDQAIEKYLAKVNNNDPKALQIARQNFIRSSAAYLVATYVLGIGDRHSGNYMIQHNGKFFHIDFGHILGDFKVKFKIKRQRTPFVFTSEFAYTMGEQKSKDFARFEVFCYNAYNTLRKNAHLIVNLMTMMVGSEIPQLQKYEQVQYMIDKLNLDMSEMQAQQHIVKEIKKTLENETRKWDNLAHERMRIG